MANPKYTLRRSNRTAFNSAMRRPVILASFVVLSAFATGRTCPPADFIAIGISQSLTRDFPPSIAQAGIPGAGALMEQSAGVPCKILPASPSDELANNLEKNAVQLGVFSGVEFAWQRTKHPALRPLAILINQHPERRAVLMVRKDNSASNFAGLKQANLAIPQRSLEHCRLFVENKCREQGTNCKQYFAQLTEPPSVEDALDDLVDGKITAAVVDQVGLKAYERRKPGRFAKLKELLTSEAFPDTVIAYHPGALDDSTLRRLRRGLCNADESPVGRHMLAMWMATSFEVPPDGFDKLLTDIVKTNPAPALAFRK